MGGPRRRRRRAREKLLHPRFDSAISGRRYYNASTGRWLSRDPSGEQGQPNLYGFVGNSPVNAFDKTGLDFATWTGAGVAYGNWTGAPFESERPGGTSTTLEGAWTMFGYLFFGDLTANLTISDGLTQLAKQNLGILKSRIGDKLRDSLVCCNTGNTRLQVRDDNFSFPENHISPLINMGQWQVLVAANCDWGCGPAKSADRSSCDCTVNCKLGVTISKTYTFKPTGYNPYNNSLGIKTLYWLSEIIQFGTSEPAYFISGKFDDSYSATLSPRSKK